MALLMKEHTGIIFTTSKVTVLHMQCRFWGHYVHIQEGQYSLPVQGQGTDIPGLEELAKSLCQEYSLSRGRFSLCLAGPHLKLQHFNLPTKKYKEAKSQLEWNESFLNNGRMAFDLVCSGTADDGCTYDWLAAAYDGEIVTRLLKAFQTQGVQLRRIDVLPAVLGRFYPTVEGTLYISNEGGFHRCVLHQGIPQTYAWDASIPPELQQWLENNDVVDCPVQPLLRSGDDLQTWLLPSVPAKFKENIRRFHLSYPAAYILAME